MECVRVGWEEWEGKEPVVFFLLFEGGRRALDVVLYDAEVDV